MHIRIPHGKLAKQQLEEMQKTIRLQSANEHQKAENTYTETAQRVQEEGCQLIGGLFALEIRGGGGGKGHLWNVLRAK